ncbi:hypothetical protein LWI29_001197 [Acer saccharum]|uniref:SNRNP25 ubiquitin-like domain-containing protein n=1 Tax=Acer saccharum TaxID=4024 RepID=A0AA39SQN7_ACESA|nr:hypothetical protein LWI29_001197 [Acer saccharum]KAK1576130.1 hypothetical protein Q3G72_011175 [Acer saccharum]
MVRVLLERRCVAPLTLNEDDGDGDDGLVRTLSYLKLPQSRLRLSVLKLDASLFDVYVPRNATVQELKQAIEEVFTLSPTEGQGMISWTHVWGHFCLCYEGQKLVNDKARIRDFNIKDGDQLKFTRHMSINYLHSKRQSKVQSVAWRQYSMSPSGSDASHEEKKLADFADKDSLENQDSYKYNQSQDAEEIPASEFKLAHFLKGWLSYSRLWGVSRKSSEGKSRPSRFSPRCFGGTSRMIPRSG